MEDSGTSGWDAIVERLGELYRAQEPIHWGTKIRYRFGGPDPLDGISAFRADGHWHFVTFGLSELYAKESELPDQSGWGFELTLRLRRAEADADPPMWPLIFLQNLARYVFSSGRVFHPGHHLDLNGPIDLENPTDIRAIVFAQDPQLEQIATPNGSLSFVQVVGITRDELDAIVGWNSTRFVDLVREREPLLVTDVARRSYLLDPGFRQRAADGAAREGSSTGVLYVGPHEWEIAGGRPGAIRLTVGANIVTQLKLLLPARLDFGESLHLVSEDRTTRFEPGTADRWQIEDDALVVYLTAPTARALAGALEPRRGDYRCAAFAALTLTVEPTRITDRNGTVVQIVG